MHSKKVVKILITDSFAEEGLNLFEKAGFKVTSDSSLDGNELKAVIKGYSALIIRSGTTVTKEKIEEADELKVIGRAGVGVDNIDVTAATRKGIIVMNTPGGNTISACEHTWALILSRLRNVPQAHNALKNGKWEKKANKGIELYGKTMGIIGLGKIGYEVAKRAVAFGMNIIVYDPYCSEEKAKKIKAEIIEFDDLIKKSDIITIHVPLNDKTRNIINSKTISNMKKDAFVINCARGGIVNEKDLADAVKEGKIRGAAIDVYENEPTTDSPLFNVDGIVHTPHLGASTEEAQERVSIEIVKQTINYLKTKKIENAVNIFGPKADISVEKLAYNLGVLLGQLSDKIAKCITINYEKSIKDGHENAIDRALLNGYLSQFNDGVNFVNAVLIAKEKGIKIIRQKDSDKISHNYMSVSIDDDISISGGVAGKIPRLTGIFNYTLDIPFIGNILIIKNNDIPGVIGKIGTILGNHEVNIAYMEVGRKSDGKAVTVIGIDETIPDALLKELKSLDTIKYVKGVKIP